MSKPITAFSSRQELHAPLTAAIFRTLHMWVLVLVSSALLAAPAWSGGNVRAVTLSGNQILFDGRETIPNGFIIQAFQFPDKELEACASSAEFCDRVLEGQDFFFARGKFAAKGALDVAEEWNVNTIRFNVSQSALDPANPDFSEDYVAKVTQAAALVRGRGFALILALFDGRNKNAPETLNSPNTKTPLNNTTSLGAAEFLAKKFGSDQGVMIELLNEPWSPGGRRKGWLLWRDGGTSKRGKFAGQSFVGVNTIIGRMRTAGARNVIVVQGIGASFQGYPGGVEDPLNNVLYSVHPFLGSGAEKKLRWDENFGNFAAKHPFLITAWNSPAKKGWCSKLGLGKPAEFLAYIKSRKIGLVAYALDVPGRLLKDYRSSVEEVSGYGDSCGDGGSAGQLIKDHFAQN